MDGLYIWEKNTPRVSSTDNYLIKYCEFDIQ